MTKCSTCPDILKPISPPVRSRPSACSTPLKEWVTGLSTAGSGTTAWRCSLDCPTAPVSFACCVDTRTGATVSWPGPPCWESSTPTALSCFIRYERDVVSTRLARRGSPITAGRRRQARSGTQPLGLGGGLGLRQGQCPRYQLPALDSAV